MPGNDATNSGTLISPIAEAPFTYRDLDSWRKKAFCLEIVRSAINATPYSPLQKRRQRWPRPWMGGLWLPSHQGSRADWPQRQSRQLSPGWSRRTSGSIGSGMDAARKRKRREKSAFSRLLLSMSEWAKKQPSAARWVVIGGAGKQPSPALRAPRSAPRPDRFALRRSSALEAVLPKACLFAPEGEGHQMAFGRF
ncbi:hypothetical protein FQZ97_1020670 [compost metagenome]